MSGMEMLEGIRLHMDKAFYLKDIEVMPDDLPY